MNVIETKGLTRHFGSLEAIQGLNLKVESGSVYALLGPNGAGKTTTLKTLVNLLHPSAGEARLLGVDSQQLTPSEWRKIGYVSENQKLPEWMTVRALLDYCRPFYPTWDSAFASQLAKQFDVDLNEKIRNLSRGTKMKVALISSLAFRPKLLLMDEPFTGLDPLVRDELIQGVLELTDQEQWTVFVASHDVDEVEKLADTVGILNNGKLHLSESIEDLQGRFRQMTARLPEAIPFPANIPASWLLLERNCGSFKFIESDYVTGITEERLKRLLPDAESVLAAPMSLREIFVVLAKTFRFVTDGGRSCT